jgi:Zn-dependent peptidase ImmA (M78 family)/DNA-binding XRE family transcriptional regulator
MSGSERFDPRRLTLARWAARLTKRELAERSGVSPPSITQYEAGRTQPPPPTVARLALALGVPGDYFSQRPGRRRPELATRSYFRSLRSTPQRVRDHADATAEQIFDLVDFLNARVTLPNPSVPQISPSVGNLREVEDIALEIRLAWNVPEGPVANVVRLLEAHGTIVARRDSGGTRLDAFSRWCGERPLVLLWSDKNDKARSRFDAAHELGHLVMHSDADPLDREQERQANMFASAFLMPRTEIGGSLVRRAPIGDQWDSVLEHRARWGVSAKALLYRSRELGALSESAFRRTMISYNQHLAGRDGNQLGEPERPVVIARALAALGMDSHDLAADALVPSSLVESFL